MRYHYIAKYFWWTDTAGLCYIPNLAATYLYILSLVFCVHGPLTFKANISSFSCRHPQLVLFRNKVLSYPQQSAKGYLHSALTSDTLMAMRKPFPLLFLSLAIVQQYAYGHTDIVTPIAVDLRHQRRARLNTAWLDGRYAYLLRSVSPGQGFVLLCPTTHKHRVLYESWCLHFTVTFTPL